MALNHHPVIGSIRLCGAKDGTATRFGSPVTCPVCVAKLSAKMVGELEIAATTRSADQRAFYTAGAKRLATVISGTHQVSA